MEEADDDESSPTNPKRLHSANIRIPFSFVTVDPGDQSKRKGNALVRAHVSRVSWTKARRSEHKLERAHHRHLVPKENASKWRVRDTSRTDPANASSHFLERLPDEGAITICLPTTNLGTGSFDPFETYPSSLPSEVVNPLIDQAYHFERKIFLANGDGTSVVNRRMGRYMSDPVLFHGLVLSQIMRRKAFNIKLEPGEAHALSLCHSEVLRGIHMRFDDPQESCSDINIFSVQILAFHSNMRTDAAGPMPSQGPLGSLKGLNIYGARLDSVPIHFEGLRKMIVMRGGLANISLAGLASTITYGDLIVASRTLRQPSVPFIPDAEYQENVMIVMSEKNHTLSNLGSGFSDIPKLLESQEASKLLSAISKISKYTLAMDDYVAARLEAPVLSMLANQRDATQHTLMSGCPWTWDFNTQAKSPFYLAIWSAATVYSLLVVFPIPVADPFARLGLQIRQHLSDPAVHDRWHEADKLLLWITFMGAIATRDSAERFWYLSVLERLTNRLRISDWPSLREELQTFLWYGKTSDADGEQLWKDVRGSNPFMT